MPRFIQLFCSCCALCGLSYSIGCAPRPAEPPVAVEPESATGDAHAHDHGDTGTHGGHLLHLSPGGAHAEWTHDDESHEIVVYLDEFDANSLESAKFVVTIGDKTEEFALEKGTSGWSITSEALMTHIEMGDAVQVSLVVTDASGQHSTRIEQHEHHHH